MYDFEQMDKRLLIFAHIFLLANRLQMKMDAAMTDLTAKQWLLLAALGLFDEPPTLGQLADASGCSHQNTKQLVNKLEQKGFVTVTPDPTDRRALRVAATARLEQWDKDNQDNSQDFVDRMFAGLTPSELEAMNSAMRKVYDTLNDF